MQLPLEWLLQTVPRLQPRSFSIASSQKAHPNEAHITVAVVKWATPFKRERHGLCSSWLASLNPNQGKIFVPIWFTSGAIKLPPPSVPLILVGPGTGCAPFHAFVEERVTILSRGDTVVAPVLFFFGCRKQAKDFLYEEDWLAWSTGKNVLSNDVGGGFFVAFSRDQSEKVYVQHKICEQVAPTYLISAERDPFDDAFATPEPFDMILCLWMKAIVSVHWIFNSYFCSVGCVRDYCTMFQKV